MSTSNHLANVNTTPRVRLLARAAFVSALALLFLAPHAHAQHAPAEAQASPTPRTTPTQQSNTQPVDASNTSNAQRVTKRATKGTTGSITGRVLGDGGEPLAGVRVLALSPTMNRSNVNAPTQTDDSGSFKIDNLPPGLYTVGAVQRGYVLDPEAYPSNRPAPLYRVGDDVTVRLVRGGVITGTVLGADGEPLIAINVRAVYVRDLEGDTQSAGVSFGEDQTDDRGVYRIYGLRQGVYVVSSGADNARNWPGAPAPYKDDSPTYYPTATRDTATELTVHAGQEVGGIDIRHRGDRGRRVTGVVLVPPQQAATSGVFVTLTHIATGTQAGTAFTRPGSVAEKPFSFEGVGEGEYEVQARTSEGGMFTTTSTPQRVVIAPTGGDVTGVRLTLTPLASVSGSFIVEPLAEAERAKGFCKERSAEAPLLPQEAMVAALKEDTPRQFTATQRATARRETAPDASGVFTLRALEAGRYRFDLRLGDEGWYVRELQLPSTTATPNANAARKPSTTTTATRETFELKSGQQLEGLSVRVAEGAATLSGRLTPREENAPPSFAQLRVHLVPAARELSDNPLRYAETTPAPDGSFTFKHLAPGRYLLLVSNAEPEAGGRARPAAWDSATRARLRREAEAADTSIELQPCQRRADFETRAPAPRD